MHTATIKGDNVVGIRAFSGASDEGVVYNPWCNQIRKLPPFVGFDGEEFKQHKKDIIEPLVARCQPVFACDPENEAHVYGWICSEIVADENILHFVYVKGLFRNNGIGTLLMKFAFPNFGTSKVVYTHKTHAIKHLEAKWSATWNPYLINQKS